MLEVDVVREDPLAGLGQQGRLLAPHGDDGGEKREAATDGEREREPLSAISLMKRRRRRIYGTSGDKDLGYNETSEGTRAKPPLHVDSLF